MKNTQKTTSKAENLYQVIAAKTSKNSGNEIVHLSVAYSTDSC